ncbi:hypothetical protein ABT224_16290 [Streptomyces sp. NPDC001584]|uniref:hypothetical protein n=1 Tax=Streptomyces sp. NPDC001584 TaxID=3154521 RepID=UPI003331662C
MITTEYVTSTTDVVVCEACWVELVEAVRTTSDSHVRDLLCIPCAEAGYPTRVTLFPPLGIYGLNGRKLKMGKHGSGSPKLPPDPGPPLPSPPPTPTPGRPPV